MTGDRVNNPKGGKIQTASGLYHSLCTVSLRHAFVKEGDGENVICADTYRVSQKKRPFVFDRPQRVPEVDYRQK